jgi:alpha-L-fucosidase
MSDDMRGATDGDATGGGGSWFHGAGLGLFVHWDHASQQGLEVSWPLTGGVFALAKCASVPVAQYHASAATFDPTEFDATELAEAARRAGMTYAVLTARHHAGYALWPTALSEYSVAHSPGRRDLVREFVDAMRAEGLRVGLYLSLSDWHHPDYPAFTDADKPYQFGASPPPPSPDRWTRYLDYLFAQVRELLTGYGTIDVLWFDGAWERPAEWWRPHQLKSLIRSLQPGILVNDRLPGVGDFATPEQLVPAQPLPGPWETCLTMNDSWGYVPDDTDYKSARQLVHTLCETVGRGGNLLLNVSPTGTGALPPEQRERLDAIAGWMAGHRESVVGTGPGLEPWQFYGPSTRRGDRVYLHLLWRPYDRVTVRGVPVKRMERVTVLGSGRELETDIRTGIIERLLPDPDGELAIEVPADVVDPLATVLAVDFAPAPA